MFFRVSRVYTYGMAKTTKANAGLLKKLNTELKSLQSQLVAANKTAGIDDYLEVKIAENQSRFERVRKSGDPDRGVGHYLLVIDITAKMQTVFIPLSIASGKKQMGFMYQIEGTGESAIATAKVKSRGDGVTQITLGTLVYAKIPAHKTASCNIQIEIKGKIGKEYTLIIHRINYKLEVTDARYNQYQKAIPSRRLKFS